MSTLDGHLVSLILRVAHIGKVILSLLPEASRIPNVNQGFGAGGLQLWFPQTFHHKSSFGGVGVIQGFSRGYIGV